ncbi:hypothetical protein K466DRAFT_121040 [Polyporus arcularius HHB13444]|uniref:Uncharacterized protein n=1 Tax=Polyporus arcularius HHB13444 TaxID=1314778 RepID=A0A5C3PUB0_9APHY|nr:hypothetical protein K466DRAFT_121040 [Polyporus arcularius HHB13444]
MDSASVTRDPAWHDPIAKATLVLALVPYTTPGTFAESPIYSYRRKFSSPSPRKRSRYPEIEGNCTTELPPNRLPAGSL